MTIDLPLRRKRMSAMKWALAAALVIPGALSSGWVFSQSLPGPVQPAAETLPSAPLPKGWDAIDQRLVFLTIQLSTVEASLDATNHALIVNGYQQTVRQEAADQARAGNELMDRKGGGPVSWQEFYGKTAEKFFYHPVDRSTSYGNPVPIPQRPPQFDYIYHANEMSRHKAEEDVRRIGNKIDDLLAYRQRLEDEQSALWAKIAFRGTSNLDIATRFYRADVTATDSSDFSKQSAAAVKAAGAFLYTIDAEMADAQTNLSGDQKAVLAQLQQTTASARAALQAQLLNLPAIAVTLTSPNSPIGQFSRAARQLADSAQNIVDAYSLACDCGTNGDQAGKQIYRGQLQQMLFDYAATVVTADKAIKDAVLQSKLRLVAGAPPLPTTTPGVAAAGGTAEDIAGRLAAAIAAHESEVAAARRTLIVAIDQRLNAAADAGDLAAVQMLQSAKMTVAGDGCLPDGAADVALLEAQKNMQRAIAVANARLLTAYHEAISSYTKARKFTEAEAVQNQLTAANLDQPSQSAVATVDKDSGSRIEACNQLSPAEASGFGRDRCPEGVFETRGIGGPGGGPFTHASPTCQPVIGFHFTMGQWNDRDCLRSLDPIYDAPPHRKEFTATYVMAREGYVVGGLLVQTDNTNAVAIRVIYMRYRDGRIIPSDSYESDWLGTPNLAVSYLLAGHGELVVGDWGHQGMNLDKIGLLVVPPDKGRL